MRSFDTLLTRTILVSLLGITLMHVLSLWSYDAALEREASHVNTSFGHGVLVSTTVMAAGIVLLSVFIARWLIRPIRKMAAAVHALNPDSESGKVPEKGPWEVRELGRAFNDRQRRIKRLIDERTRALAAVSHDLRTPLTRLKLRLEDVNPVTASAMAADIEELEQMIEATLSYLKGDDAGEQPRPIDLAALLETLASDAFDRGQEVSVSGPRSLTVFGRRIGLKRAFANIIQNALKYGDRARVSLLVLPEAVQVQIDDDGPGIPADKLSLVLEPFVRLEDSRSRETGGAGLGLAIAKANVEASGGSLSLSNRPEGGLRVLVTLPLTKAGVANRIDTHESPPLV
jgi:two-component system OmpR family sensor kinase